jgi:hypothetical protein
VSLIRWWLKRPPGLIEKYLSSTFFPYHFLAASLLLMVIYWATTSIVPEWLAFGP